MISHKVTYARLHQAPHLPNVGTMDNVFPAVGKTYDGLDMSVSDLGLRINFKYKGIESRILVPLANVVIMLLAPDTAAPVKAK